MTGRPSSSGPSREERVRWDHDWRSRSVDAGVAVVAGLASVAALVSADEIGSRAADATAGLVLSAAAAFLVVRREHPRIALFGTVGLTLVYLALGYPGGAELPVLMVVFYSVAAVGQRWETVLAVVLFGGGGAVYRAAVEREPFLEIALTVALLVLAFLLGDSVSTRRRLRAEIRERLRAAAVEKDLEARARLSAERVRIAQELHDVLAHTVTTMTVHAGAAADLLPDQPEQAQRSLATLRRSSREAMAELRATITVLRAGGEESDRHPAPGLAQLRPLVRGVEQAGLPVTLEISGGRGDLPAAVELTVYRVVQEGLTNVMRHARATRAWVCVEVGRSTVEVTVEDDGAGHEAGDGQAAERQAQSGAGLVGLAERARALGGTVSAKDCPGGGFRVHASLPLQEAAR